MIKKKEPERKTVLQWAREGYIPKRTAVGKYEWTNNYHHTRAMFFAKSEVRKNEEKAKQFLREKRRTYRRNTNLRKKAFEEVAQYRSVTHTRWQWLFGHGRIPNADAKWVDGKTLRHRFTNTRLNVFIAAWSDLCDYCHIDDTHLPSSPEELESAQREYNDNYKR